MLGDGIVTSVSTLDAKLSEAQRKRIFLEYGKVLAVYAPLLTRIRHSLRDWCGKRTSTWFITAAQNLTYAMLKA